MIANKVKYQNEKHREADLQIGNPRLFKIICI